MLVASMAADVEGKASLADRWTGLPMAAAGDLPSPPPAETATEEGNKPADDIAELPHPLPAGSMARAAALIDLLDGAVEHVDALGLRPSVAVTAGLLLLDTHVFVCGATWSERREASHRLEIYCCEALMIRSRTSL